MDLDISSFILKHDLPESYTAHAEQWFLPLAKQLSQTQSTLNRPLVIGVNGCQGSGKSTLSDLLVFLFEQHFNQRAVSLSIDDFYHTRQTRQTLSETIHPLLLTRGVPGTHDVTMAIDVIKQLKHQQTPVTIPRFNKAIDDRAEQTQQLNHPVGLIIVEGWCIGTSPQTQSALIDAVNELEQHEDSDGKWRQYVNQQLAGEYQQLFDLIDTQIMLKAPSFDTVYHWRLEQEDKLRKSKTAQQSDQQHIMSPAQIKRFVQLYQRLTEHTLATLPEKTHFLFKLDNNRQISQLTTKPNTTIQHCLIFTDLDGTLLDHDTYSFEPAKPMLEKLAEKPIPVILISSKTQAELMDLSTQLNNSHPFISENGAAVFIPSGYFEQQPDDTIQQGNYWLKTFVEPREQWQSMVNDLKANYPNRFITFSDMGIDGIIDMTGLSEQAASLAAQRQFGEPIKWLGDEQQKQHFIQTLESQGATVLEGGRFIHVSGSTNKGQALQWLTAQYQQALNKPVTTIALGDSHNDVAMLSAADHAIWIRSPAHEVPELVHPQQQISEATGPIGWAQSITNLLNIR